MSGQNLSQIVLTIIKGGRGAGQEEEFPTAILKYHATSETLLRRSLKSVAVLLAGGLQEHTP